MSTAHLRTLAFAGLVAALLSTTGCGLAGGSDKSNPTAQQDAAKILHERTVAAYGGELSNIPVTRYVTTVARSIPSAGPAEVYLLNSEEANHFTLPGKIYVTRGLLARLDNEAQLAAVLGLEKGHLKNNSVQNRINEAERVAREQGFLDKVQGVFVKRKFDPLEILTMATQRPENGQFAIEFTEQEEDQATAEALKSMTQLGYDPEQFYLYLDTMLRAKDDSKVEKQVTMTHRINDRRAIKVQDQIAAIKKDNPTREWKVGSRPYREGVLDHLKPTAVGVAN